MFLSFLALMFLLKTKHSCSVQNINYLLGKNCKSIKALVLHQDLCKQKFGLILLVKDTVKRLSISHFHITFRTGTQSSTF